jgi:hypothetical protein
MTQTRGERRAYLREYIQRPEVIARRRAWHAERRARMSDEERAQKRAKDREYQRRRRAERSEA